MTEAVHFFSAHWSVVGLLTGVVVATTALHRAWSYFALKRKGLREPPGPPPRFLFANLLDLPTADLHIGFARMAEHYGPIMKFSTPTSTFIVLSSAKVVQDLLDKQGGISADRPRMHMAELSGWSWSIGIMRYGPALRARRKIVHQYLDQRAIPRYEAQITRSVLALAQKLLRTPDDFFEHLKHAAGSIILRITYGIEVSGENDPYIKLGDDAMRGWAAVLIPGVWVIDWIPILKHLPAWFPGASFKRFAEEQKKYPEDMHNIPFSLVQKQMEQGSCLPCMVSECLSADSEEELDVVKDAAGFMYLAGVDTTATTMQSFFLAMVLNPAVQRAAQEELDRVIGLDRLPNFADRRSLPYTEALVLELLRVYPAGPLGIAHALDEDGVYDGMFFRKGTTLLPNIWAILQDAQVYADPHTFKPERFLRNGHLDDSVPDPRVHVFGYGRRICPGEHLADASLFIEIAIILSCFDISKKVENGIEITPPGEYIHTALSAPVPFQCSIRPRTEKTASRIAQALEAAA